MFIQYQKNIFTAIDTKHESLVSQLITVHGIIIVLDVK